MFDVQGFVSCSSSIVKGNHVMHIGGKLESSHHIALVSFVLPTFYDVIIRAGGNRELRRILAANMPWVKRLTLLCFPLGTLKPGFERNFEISRLLNVVCHRTRWESFARHRISSDRRSRRFPRIAGRTETPNGSHIFWVKRGEGLKIGRPLAIHGQTFCRNRTDFWVICR
jgi:hypothetical protein